MPQQESSKKSKKLWVMPSTRGGDYKIHGDSALVAEAKQAGVKKRPPEPWG
jgi:hypothetical protein